MSRPISPTTPARKARKEFCDRTGFTAEKIGQKIGCSAASVVNADRVGARPCFHLASRLAKALGIPVDLYLQNGPVPAKKPKAKRRTGKRTATKGSALGAMRSGKEQQSHVTEPARTAIPAGSRSKQMLSPTVLPQSSDLERQIEMHLSRLEDEEKSQGSRPFQVGPYRICSEYGGLEGPWVVEFMGDSYGRYYSKAEAIADVKKRLPATMRVMEEARAQQRQMIADMLGGLAGVA